MAALVARKLRGVAVASFLKGILLVTQDQKARAGTAQVPRLEEEAVGATSEVEAVRSQEVAAVHRLVQDQ